MTGLPATPEAPSASARARETFGRALAPLLANQLRRLRRRYIWYGAGISLLLPAVAIALFFVLDHTLRLPLPVRLLHSTVVVGIAVFAVARFLVYPLGRRLAAIDVAQLLERAFPELHQRLVSTVQLANQPDAGLRNQSSAMIDALAAETAQTAARLPLERLYDARRTSTVLAGACAALTVLGAGALTAPEAASIFLLRHLGVAAEYPRETYLSIDLPAAGPELQRFDSDGRTELVLPAGGELHVSVLATGVVPDEVFLDVSALVDDQPTDGARATARSIAMTPRPGDRFRYVFRKISGAFEFHARGGDDEHGDRIVVVRTIRPPEVATIRAIIRPPAYTGVDSVEQLGGGIEALVGSEIELRVTTTALVRSATMAFLESGRRLDLDPVTVPDDSGAALAWRARFGMQASDRYQIELLDDSGLRNPDPGTYPIAALADYAPVGSWLLPEEQSSLMLPGALLCLRLEARDDFGLAAVDLEIERSGEAVLTRPLLAAPTPAGAAGPTGAPKRAITTELIELEPLLAAGDAGSRAAGDGLAIAVRVRDNCEPTASEAELPRRIVQIVDPPQLVEMIGRHFRQLREETDGALDIQLDRRLRLEEFGAAPTVGGSEVGQVFSAVEVGQSRVLGSCERLHRGLMEAFDIHLWNRLEPSEHAVAVIELYREFSARLDRPVARDPEFYRELGRRRASGAIGSLETVLDPILQMIAIADAIAAVDGPRACRLLTELQVARPAERPALLQETLTLQQQIADALEELLRRLQEWNDYQDLVQEARALRDRQRDIRTRTEELRGKK